MSLYTLENNRHIFNENAFAQLVTEIMANLGSEWKIDDTHDRFDRSVIDIINKDGRGGFSLRVPAYPNKNEAINPRVEISGIFHVNNQYVLQHISDSVREKYTTRITCSFNRGAKSIADDIKKRLLPGCSELLAIGLEQVAEKEAREQEIQSRVAELAKAIDSHPHRHGDHQTYDYLQLKSSEESINVVTKSQHDGKANIKIDSLPHSLALELMEWIAERVENPFERWRKKISATFIRWLDDAAAKQGEAEVTTLPANDFNWRQAYDDIHLPNAIDIITERKLFVRFKDSMIEVEPEATPAPDVAPIDAEPTAEAEPEATPAPDIAPIDAEPTAEEIHHLYQSDEEELTRLLQTPEYYRDVLKDELLRIRDRRVLRNKLKISQTVLKNNPELKDNKRAMRMLAILEMLNEKHTPTNTQLILTSLKKQFSTFKEAKLATQTKAISWQKLAEKLAA